MTIPQLNRKINDLRMMVEQLRQEVERMNNPERPRNEPVMRIVTAVASQYGIDPEVMFSSSQKRNIVDARQMAMYLIYYTLHYSLAKTGRIFSKDHSSVSHSVKEVQTQLEVNKAVRCLFIAACHEIGVAPEAVNEMLPTHNNNHN